jgi:AraC-like DNA-binding protein
MGAHELALIGLAGSSVGTALSVPMVWPRAARPLDVRLLGGAFLLMSAVAALISARLAGLAPASAEVGHTINMLGLCTFPLLVLYTRHATGASVSRSDAAWWAPAGAYAGLVAIRGVDESVPFAWMLPVVCGFTAASIATLWRRRGHRRPTLVPAESVVAFVVLLNAAQVVRMELGHVAVVRALVPLVISAGFIAMAAFATWRSTTIRNDPEAARYERSGLDEAIAPALLARIEAALTRDRLFARADLTLAELAAAASATPHQVSEALNRYAGVSFNDLVNRRRVADVKAQLLDPGSARFTIEGIGAAAGFGSRSALYAAFKRFEGQTPTRFRAAAQTRD